MFTKWITVLCLSGLLLVAAWTDHAFAQDAKPELQVIWQQYGKCDALKKLTPDYAAAKVVVNCVSNLDWHKTIFDTFDAKTGADLVVLDSQWIGEAAAAGHLVDLTEWLNKNLDVPKYVPAALSAYGEYPADSGRYYGVPMEADTHMLVYRKDLFQQAGLQPPKTWDELLNHAKTLMEKTLIDFGYTTFWCGDCYDDIQTAWNELAWSFGGEIWDPATYKIEGVLNSPANVAATGFAAELYNVGPPGNHFQGDLPKMICDGTVAMITTWFGYTPAFTDPASCPQSQNLAYAVVPAGPEAHVLSLGGMGIQVSAYTKHQQAALDFLAWLHTKPVQLRWAELGGSPARVDVLASPVFAKASPSNLALAASYPLVKDFWNLPEYSKLLPIQGKYLNLAITGQMEPQAALDEIAKQQQAILDAAYPNGPVTK